MSSLGFTPNHPEPQPEKLGRYEILGVLGTGGMGRVLLGFDPLLNRKVAIKTVHAQGGDATLHEELQTRLFREARAAGSLKHDGIVGIYDVLRIEEQGFIVMEFVSGKTLEARLPPTAPIDFGFAFKVLRESAAALDHAHANNIVHRDIKPGNIMVDQDTGAIRITDFGIAKIMGGEGHTEPGMVLGTFQYMAPEQLRGKDVDGRADQFALAVLAQRMLTGASMYNADTIRRLTYQIVEEPPPSAHGLNPDLPQTVDAVFSKALAKDPTARYPTCSAFVEALESAFRGPAPDAATSPTVYPVERNPTQFSQEPAPSRISRLLPIIGVSVIGAIVLVAGVIFLDQHRRASVDAIKPVAIETPTVVPSPNPALAPTLTLPGGEMVLVEGGAAVLGPDRQTSRLEAFYIDTTEVTNEAYLAFAQATGHKIPREAQQAPGGNPIVSVTFEDAQAFAKWAGKRLPTAAEWEKAARGSDGRDYPWGNDWKEGAANLPANAGSKMVLAPARSFPPGASAYGALNMLGNVWEWVDTEAVPDDTAFKQLSRIFKNLQPPLSRTEPMYQARGGSYRFQIAAHDRPSLISDWLAIPARVSRDDLGFRCARNP